MWKRLQVLQKWKRGISRSPSDRSDSECEEAKGASDQRTLGLIIGDIDPVHADAKNLHSAAIQGHKKDVLNVLSTGVSVDFPNDAGQTALFCATLMGKCGTVELLLKNGANPNEKSDTGVTPVHVACLKASLRALEAMIEAGGDLRLHDNEGNGCMDWARCHPDPKKRVKLLEFLQRSHMLALSHSGDFVGRTNSLVRQPSILKILRGRAGGQVSLDFGKETGVNRVPSRGSGLVFCGGAPSGGAVSVIPFVTESELLVDTNGITFESSSGFTMASMMWRMTSVTVKKLDYPLQGNSSQDLLISEVEHLSKLRHPNVLLLMGQCQSSSFGNLMPIFERVSIGSLHYILHEKADHLPMTYIRDIAIQVSQAMLYIHDQNYVHCSLSSHAVLMVSMHQAKVGGMEYMIQTKKSLTGRKCLVATSPHKEHLFRWMAPEVMTGGLPRPASDVYSFSSVLWEMITSELPWDSASATQVLEKHKSGTAELPSPPKCVELFQVILKHGLGKDPDDRPQDFVTLFRWLHGPLDKPPNMKTYTLDCLKTLQKESTERISLRSGFNNLFSLLGNSSRISQHSLSNTTLPTQASSCALTVAAGASITEQTAERANSDSTNNHSSVTHTVTSADSCSTIAKGGDSLEIDLQDGCGTEKWMYCSDSDDRNKKFQHQSGNTDEFRTMGLEQLEGRRYERTSSLSAVGRVLKSSKQRVSLPWQGSLGRNRAGSPSQRLSRSPRKRTGPENKAVMDVDEQSDKRLPLVKPASHSTDIKYFARGDQGSVTRTMSSHCSLPRLRNSQLFTPGTFPRSKSAAGDVIETGQKDIELSAPGSVRTLTEQFQAHLYNHTLRQSILRGSRTPHGTLFDDLDISPTCLKQLPDRNEIPPEGNRHSDVGIQVKETLTDSSKDSTESLTSVSFRDESLLGDDEQGLPLSSRNELDITNERALLKPSPIYPRCSTQMQEKPEVNTKAVQSQGMFQEQSAFRVVNTELSLSEHHCTGKNYTSDTDVEPKSNSQFLPSSIPGTDFSTHPFDFRDYYIGDDYTVVGDNNPTLLESDKCQVREPSRTGDRSRHRRKERVWLRDTQRRRKQRIEQEEKEEDRYAKCWWLIEQKEAEEYWKETRSVPNQPEREKYSSYKKEDQWLEDQWQDERKFIVDNEQTREFCGQQVWAVSEICSELLNTGEDWQLIDGQDRGKQMKETSTKDSTNWSTDGKVDGHEESEEQNPRREFPTHSVQQTGECTEDFIFRENITRTEDQQINETTQPDNKREMTNNQEVISYREDEFDLNEYHSTGDQCQKRDGLHERNEVKEQLFPGCISVLSSGNSSVSTVVQRPNQDTWDHSVYVNEVNEENDDDSDNDRTLLADDKPDHRRCILLHLERNVLSQEGD